MRLEQHRAVGHRHQRGSSAGTGTTRSARGRGRRSAPPGERLLRRCGKGWPGSRASGVRDRHPRARERWPRAPRRRRQRVGVRAAPRPSPARGGSRRISTGPATDHQSVQALRTACSCSAGLIASGRSPRRGRPLLLRPATRIMRTRRERRSRWRGSGSRSISGTCRSAASVEQALDEGDVRLLAVMKLRGCRAPSLRPSRPATEDNTIHHFRRSAGRAWRGRDESVTMRERTTALRFSAQRRRPPSFFSWPHRLRAAFSSTRREAGGADGTGAGAGRSRRRRAPRRPPAQELREGSLRAARSRCRALAAAEAPAARALACRLQHSLGTPAPVLRRRDRQRQGARPSGAPLRGVEEKPPKAVRPTEKTTAAAASGGKSAKEQ